MIKRATSDIKLVEKRFPVESQEFTDKIRKLQPVDEDLSDAVEGLLRLQTVYMWKSDDFAKGIIDGQKTRPDLSAHDLFVIGSEAFKLSRQDYFDKEYFRPVPIRLHSNEVVNIGHENSIFLKFIKQKFLLNFTNKSTIVDLTKRAYNMSSITSNNFSFPK